MPDDTVPLVCERCVEAGWAPRTVTTISHAWRREGTLLCDSHTWPEDDPSHSVDRPCDEHCQRIIEDDFAGEP